MHLTKQDLLNKIKNLRIQLSTTEKYTKIKLIQVLAAHYYAALGETSNDLQSIMTLESHMLCSKFTDLTNTERDKLFTSNKYIAEDKIPGVRCWITYSPEEGFHIFGRGINEYFLPIDYSQQAFIHCPSFSVENQKTYINPSNFKGAFKTSFILDAEIYFTGKFDFNFFGPVHSIEMNMTNALLKLTSDQILSLLVRNQSRFDFYILDCFSFDGRCLKDQSLSHRKFVQETLVENLKRKYPDLPFTNIRKYITTSDKDAAWQAQVLNNGEGLVFKPISSTYNPTTVRRKDGWIKLKTNMEIHSQKEDLSDIDAFVTGFESESNFPYITGLKFSINVRNSKTGLTSIRELGTLTDITPYMQRELTILEENKPVLKEIYYNKVCSLSASGKTKTGMLLDIRSVLDFRVDKTSFECIITE